MFQSPELEARIQRLKAEQANREYKEMVRSVDKEQVHSGLISDGFIFCCNWYARFDQSAYRIISLFFSNMICLLNLQLCLYYDKV